MGKCKVREALDLKNCVVDLEVAADVDSTMMLISLVKGDEREDLTRLKRVDGQVSEDVSKGLAYYYLKDSDSLNIQRLTKIVDGISARYKRVDIQLDVDSLKPKTGCPKRALKVIAETILLQRHRLFSLKSESEERGRVRLVTKLEGAAELVEGVKKVVSRINLVRNLQVLPPNIANSTLLADSYREHLLNNPKIKTTTLGRAEIEEKGMGLLLAVNKGSEHEPRLVVAEFYNNPDSEERIALVGKGITFDSGGYNLKPSAHMSEMKFDMSGSAIVAGVISLVAELNLKVNVVGLMPLTDNMIGTKAGTPDSVWRSYSGKSVEINNTDAEGRLILADAMTYAIRDCKASEVITVATLTGAMLYCLGHTFTGYWSTKDESVKLLEEAAKGSDELIWRMPFHEDFLTNFKDTVVADMTNVNMKSKAGSSNAAMFLKEFSEDKIFSHFDIAGTAYQGGVPRSPLVKTLLRYLEMRSAGGGKETKGSCSL